MPRYEQEVLVISGRLDRAGRFVPRRCRSTRFVRQWPVIEGTEYSVELVASDGVVLHREPARVTPDVGCDPGDARRYRVLAYIVLRPDARELRLRRDDLVIWETRISGAAKVKVELQGRPTRASGALLALHVSEAGESAHATVVYQWGERRFRPAYVGSPSQKIRIDLRQMPGGEKCRFLVTYSNGMRSAGSATRYFRLPRIGPALAIARPSRNQPVAAGTPVILEGHVTDPERAGGARPDEHLVWLIDRAQVGTGPITSVDGLTAGSHQVTLVYRGEHGTAQRSVQLRVRRSELPTANDWEDWDPTDDRA
jgi:hypothetical protein